MEGSDKYIRHTDQNEDMQTLFQPKTFRVLREVFLLLSLYEFYLQEIVPSVPAQHSLLLQLYLLQVWLPIAPGKSGEITIHFDPSGRRGEFDREVKVKTNAQKKRISLKFSGVIIPE